MAKKRPKVNLAQAIQPRSGDLEKLFATDGDVEQAAGLQLLSIRLDAIRPDPNQPRQTFPQDSLQELGESIRQDGVIQPIEVTETAPEQYMIVHGERRWRAAQLAGLETMPAVVRRTDYDTLTRLVRQLVENIQREDLNDVDRAAGLLGLRELMQSELAAADDGDDAANSVPWAKTISWAKVGNRLGMSRQRINQLIKLLDLPSEIREDVRSGRLSERETRIYQGLNKRQQRDLHKARYQQNLSPTEIKGIAQLLKSDQEMAVSQAMRIVRRPEKSDDLEPPFETSFEEIAARPPVPAREDESLKPLRSQPWTEGSILPPRTTRPTSIDRLDWIRGHLARIQRQDLSPAERREIVRLLTLIQQDIASLLTALRADDEAKE
jgi:ParB family chromosome partitioning protein